MSDETPKSDHLTVFNMTSAEFGAALLQAARDKAQKESLTAATEEVSQLLQTIDAYKLKIREYSRHVEVNEKRVAAIQEGKFKMGKNGSVEYDDDQLSKYPRGYTL